MAGVLDGKVALVTGGSRGIGRAIVHRLAHDGAAVVFSFHTNQAAAEEVAAEVTRGGGRAVAVRADQQDPRDLETLFATAEQRHGGLDILVNSAAIYPQTTIIDTTEHDYDQVMAVNTKGPFMAMRHAGRRLRDHGRIINLSTINTALPEPGTALYAASKAALEQFTAVAAREFGHRGITANSVSPGATDTDLLRARMPTEAVEQMTAVTALQRLGQPADIADVVAFLAGPDSRWITGQNLRATGGLLV